MSTAIHHHVLRSVSLSIHPCICPSTSSSSFPSIYLATHAFIWSTTLLAIFRSSDLCIYHLSVYLSIYLSIYLSMYLSIDRSIYLSIYHFFLTAWCTKQVCETSVDNIKDEPLLRNFLQKWKDQCCTHTLVPIRSAIFLPHLSKVLRLRKILLANLHFWYSKM